MWLASSDGGEPAGGRDAELARGGPTGSAWSAAVVSARGDSTTAPMVLSCARESSAVLFGAGLLAGAATQLPLDAHQLLEQQRPLRLRHVDQELLDPRPFSVLPGALEPLGRRVDPATVRRRDFGHVNLAMANDRTRELTYLPWSGPPPGSSVDSREPPRDGRERCGMAPPYRSIKIPTGFPIPAAGSFELIPEVRTPRTHRALDCGSAGSTRG